MSPAARIVLGCAVLAGSFLLLLGLVAVVYLARRSSGGDRDGLVVVQPDAAAPRSSLDAQAIAQVREQFETLWVKRDDLWYAVNSFGGPNSRIPRELVAAKGISFKVQSMPLTEADRLNELEWRGKVECGASASRTRVLDSEGGWSDWKAGLALYAGDGEAMLRTETYTLERKSGQWRIIGSDCKSVRRVTPEELDKAKL